MLGDRIHADRVVRAGEHDALHALAARAFVDFDETAQVVLDDFRQRTLHAGTREMDQHVDAFEQTIHHGGVAQVAVHHVLAVDQRRQRFRASRRTQRNAARDQRSTYDRA